jgi:hypothetical protein
VLTGTYSFHIGSAVVYVYLRDAAGQTIKYGSSAACSQAGCTIRVPSIAYERPAPM